MFSEGAKGGQSDPLNNLAGSWDGFAALLGFESALNAGYSADENR
jgi:hypothetical protein